MSVVSDSLTPNLGLKDIGEVCRPVVCAHHVVASCVSLLLCGCVCLS